MRTTVDGSSVSFCKQVESPQNFLVNIRLRGKKFRCTLFSHTFYDNKVF